MSDGKLYSQWSSCAANSCSEDKINPISQVCASPFLRRFACPILLSLMHSCPRVFLILSLPAEVLDLMECIQANKVITKAFISQFFKNKLSNIYLRKHSIALPGRFPSLLHNVDTFGIGILLGSSLRKECQVVTSAGLGARANTSCCLSQGLCFFWSSKDQWKQNYLYKGILAEGSYSSQISSCCSRVLPLNITQRTPVCPFRIYETMCYETICWESMADNLMRLLCEKDVIFLHCITWKFSPILKLWCMQILAHASKEVKVIFPHSPKNSSLLGKKCCQTTLIYNSLVKLMQACIPRKTSHFPFCGSKNLRKPINQPLNSLYDFTALGE